MPTGPPAARLPLPVRRRATWGSPDRLMCEWPECRVGPHLDRDAKINCCRHRGLVRPAVASYLIVLWAWVWVRVRVRARPAVCACPGAPGIDTGLAARGAVLDSGLWTLASLVRMGTTGAARNTADLRAAEGRHKAHEDWTEGPGILSPPAC